MSSNIVLIEFKPDESGNICEDYATSIESTFIGDSLLQKITNKFQLVEEDIQEEYQSKEYSAYEFFKNEDIDDVIMFLDELIISDVSLASNEFDSEVISQEALRLIKIELRTLLNVSAVFELKRNNFFDNKYVKIKVSR